MNEKTAHGIARGLACGRLCVLRQWFNRLVCSCLIVKNMFVKVKTKEYCKSRLLVSCSPRFWNKKITYDITLFMSERRTNC